MEVGTTTNNLTARLPILNPGDYDLWLMRIEQYFLMTDYSLWEVIKNGNKVLRRTVEPVYEPTTAEDKQDRRNEMKARATLLMALPNKDQLKFHSYQDAKLPMEAIEKSQEDMNLKLLTSLPSEWKTHALIWRNKNVAFVSNNTNNTNNTNKADDTVHGVSTTYSTTHTQEEMDLQWEIAMLKIRARRFIKRTGKKLDINGQRVGFDKSKVECFNCHKHGHFARECSYQAEEEQPTNHALMAFTSSGSSSSSDSEVDSCSKTYVKACASLKEQYDNLSFDYKKSQFKLVSYKAVRLRDNALNEYKMNLENTEKERDQLKQTLEKFQNSSKSLNNILESQSGSDKGYHLVPPPLTGNFIPRKLDLTFMDEIVESENLDVTTVVTPCNDKTIENKGVSNTVESNAVRMNNTSAPIIEDWNSDDESEIDYTVSPSTKKIKYVKTVREIDAPKQNKHNPRGNQRN
ncbi:copia protein [Tanacetum coccineum]